MSRIKEINEQQQVMMFVASCVEWVAEELGGDYLAVFERMDKVGLIENYIIKCYNVLHLESRQSVTQDIVETLLLWEQNQKAKQ